MEQRKPDRTLDRDGQIAVLHSLLDIGEMLVCSGAEINRVEDTLARIGYSYGAEHMDIFAIMSSIIVTAVFPGYREVTLTRRITSPGPTDFTKIEELNALSRECCKASFSPGKLREKVCRIREEQLSDRDLIAGSLIGSFSFAVFFGGTVADGLTSAGIALLICFLQKRVVKYMPNTVTSNLVISVFMGALIWSITRLLPFLHQDWVAIGDIMLLIPGLAMTNAIRDVLVGDTIAGLMRLIESLLWAGAIAAGFMVAFWFLQEVVA